LAFTAEEAAEVLSASGVAVDALDAEQLFSRTNGWPIAHYLCALILRDAADPTLMVREIIEDDGELARGLTYRWLANIPATTRRFLTRTSVLMTLTGPLCDWLLEAADSDERLAELAAENMLVTPVHSAVGAYRYQRLFGELLRAELNDRRPDAAAFLHGRAGNWFAGHGDDIAARWHRQAAHSAARNGAPADVSDEKPRAGAPDMSLAELQVLAFLPSHLSFDDIGMRVG